MQIADARPHDRFTGEAPEPRAGMRSGHMPGAHSVPFSLLAEKGRLRSADQLRAAFEQAGIDLSKPVVTTCGSGVTAAALSLALETLGHSDHKLYDGSWSEWGGREDTQSRQERLNVPATTHFGHNGGDKGNSSINCRGRAPAEMPGLPDAHAQQPSCRPFRTDQSHPG